MQRRAVLTAGLAASLTHAQRPPVRYGLLGAGQRGSVHARQIASLAPEATLAAIADPDAAARERIAKAHPDTKLYSSADALLNDSSLQAVVIASPNFFHAQHAIQAMEQGKHVLCEKPIAIRTSEVDRIESAARATQRIFLPAHELRFAPVYERLLAELPKIGRIRQMIHHEYRGDWFAGGWKAEDPRTGKRINWRHLNSASGGTLLEKSLHFLDLFHMLMRTPAQDAYCHGGIAAYRDGRDAWDHLTLHASFADGVSASHVLSMFHRPVENRLLVLGESGVLQVDGHSRLSHYAYGSKPTTLFDTGAGENALALDHTGDREMHRAFFQAITGARKLPFGVEVGTSAVRVALRAYDPLSA